MFILCICLSFMACSWLYWLMPRIYFPSVYFISEMIDGDIVIIYMDDYNNKQFQKFLLVNWRSQENFHVILSLSGMKPMIIILMVILLNVIESSRIILTSRQDENRYVSILFNFTCIIKNHCLLNKCNCLGPTIMLEQHYWTQFCHLMQRLSIIYHCCKMLFSVTVKCFETRVF